MRDCTFNYIGGAWTKPATGRVLDVVDPASEDVAGRISLSTSDDVDRAVDAARSALPAYAAWSRGQRLELLEAVLGTMVRRRQDVADAIRVEMGAPARFAFEMQAGAAIEMLRTGIAVLRDFPFQTQASERSRVVREPIGVVGLITPWNWPAVLIMTKLVPALATGNAVVHKPSEVAPFSAHVIAEILHEAGVPSGVYNLVNGTGPEAGAAIAAHPGIDMVSFTGSTTAGIDVARRAAATVKRVTQELGGKSPNLVLDDADLGRAVEENVVRAMLNSGQTCYAPTRLLVPNGRLDEAAVAAAKVAAGLTVGDPRSDVFMGPLVSAAQWDRVQGYIASGIAEGATLVAGGPGRPAGLDRGFYARPTVFSNVTPQMTIAREEIFGPVLCIMGYANEDEAIAIANDSDYGLGAFVQAGSDTRAAAVAAKLRSGTVFLNGAGEDSFAPFGGYKRSGNGREWGSFGFDEFTEVKSIIMRQAA